MPLSKHDASVIDFFRRSEIEIRRLNARVHETFQQRDRSATAHEEWKKACAEFHARCDPPARVAYSGFIQCGLQFAREIAGHWKSPYFRWGTHARLGL